MTASETADLAGASRPDDVGRVLLERAKALAAPPPDPHRGRGAPYLVAVVGALRVAVPAARVRRVVVPGPLARLVAAGPGIVGLAAVQGALVPVADLAALLGLTGHSRDGGQPRLLVVDDDRSPFGLLVDDVQGVEVLAADDVVPYGDGPAGRQSLAGHAPGGLFVLELTALLSDPRLHPVTTAAPDGIQPSRKTGTT